MIARSMGRSRCVVALNRAQRVERRRDEIRRNNVFPRNGWQFGVQFAKQRHRTHTLETHIYRLPQKFERNPSKLELLVAEPGG